MNKIIVIGNLTRDVEKVEANQTMLAKMTVACRGFGKDENGNSKTTFFNVIAWNKVAESCLQYLQKGSTVAICGKMQNRSYEVDGVKKFVSEIVADEVEFLSKKEESPF